MSLPPFSYRHLPVLFVATTTTFGGLMPFFAPHRAIREFGLPERIASSQPAQSVMILSSARISAIGLMLYTFYSRGQLTEVDTIMAIVGTYVGAVDAWVCWMEGVPGKAAFRGLSGAAIAAWGWWGMTSTP